MSEQSAQEKTEKATFHRRQKAREDGKVVKSQELNSAAMLLLGFTALYMLGPHLAGQAREMMSFTMSNAPSIAAAIYNAMVAPIVGYGVRGAIWYQGESNSGEGLGYLPKLKALVEGWRSVWNQPTDFPFYPTPI